MKIKVKKSVRVRGPKLDNGPLTRIGKAMLTEQKKRISEGITANSNKATPLGKGYAIFKKNYLKKHRGINVNRPIRDINLTGHTMEKFTLRRAMDKVIRAEVTGGQDPRTKDARKAKGLKPFDARGKMRFAMKGNQMIGFAKTDREVVYGETVKEYGKWVKRAVMQVNA